MFGRMLCRVRLHHWRRTPARDGNGVYLVCRRCAREADYSGTLYVGERW
ncbi:hypothetical protein [Aquipuribacter sp. SD81]